MATTTTMFGEGTKRCNGQTCSVNQHRDNFLAVRFRGEQEETVIKNILICGLQLKINHLTEDTNKRVIFNKNESCKINI